MGGFSIAEFNFELVDTVLYGLELFDLGAEPIPVGQAFVELGNAVTEDAHFLLHDLPGLLGVSRGLLGSFEFMSLRGKHRLHFTHASASCSGFCLRVRQLF